MIKSSDAYKSAVTADARQMRLRAVVDIVSPDIVYGEILSSGADRYTNESQLYDRVFAGGEPVVTLEQNRWLLDGTAVLDADGVQTGFESDGLFDEHGEGSLFVELPFSGVTVLQACAIYFSDRDVDGVPVDFTVEILSGGQTMFQQAFIENADTSVKLDGFTVHYPDAVRVTCTRWSLPNRRFRVMEIIPGIYEEWTEHELAAFSVTQQGNFAATALPYGTCTLKMDNQSRRFEPRKKNGLFQSIEDRQGIVLSIGAALPDGTTEYKPIGVFYQFSGGWRTGDNALSMQWTLVDICGLLTDRAFTVPTTLPTTLHGWTAALTAQLGGNFEGRYTVDPSYAELPITAAADAVSGRKCGEILLWICQAAGVWPRADAETGFLSLEPLWSEGGELTLDNLTAYPTISANDDIASIVLTLSTGEMLTIGGTSVSSPNALSIDNPFLHTREQAISCAKHILSTYGGNRLTTVGRGNPACEIGDVDTLWLDQSTATTGRRLSQTLSFSGGVLQNCQSVLLQADGGDLFRETETIEANGTFTVPDGVTALRLTLVGRGTDGEDGTAGTWNRAGVRGADGAGGMVWHGTISVMPGQTFTVTVGEHATFGQLSSTDGKVYENGFTEIETGRSFARTGVVSPLPGSGDGGRGGSAGAQGHRTRTEDGSYKVQNRPTAGGTGAPGAVGCVVISWAKEAS